MKKSVSKKEVEVASEKDDKLINDNTETIETTETINSDEKRANKGDKKKGKKKK